ncbi:MAG: hypothetical protein U1E13_03800 [Methylophilaceae bacterium]|nr:hypothetical protein [Polynucleobacter sp.]MDZ4097808.1 hypothetical protein [Methylophilaceae bacterium]
MDILQNLVIAARLSIQRALLGEISPQLRAVVFSIVGRDIDVRFYFDGLISEADAESASFVETEIIADYEAEDTVTVRCIRLDFPEPIEDDGVWVYQRREIPRD